MCKIIFLTFVFLINLTSLFANSIKICEQYIFDGKYDRALETIYVINDENIPSIRYKKLMLLAEINYQTKNIEYFKYYTDSAQILLKVRLVKSNAYQAEVYRNYSKYFHFNAMAHKAVPYADSALSLYHVYKPEMNRIEAYSLFLAKASAERNNARGVVKYYFDTAYQLFYNQPGISIFRMVELHRSFANYNQDFLNNKRLDVKQKFPYYKAAMHAYNQAIDILENNFPSNYGERGMINCLKGLANSMVGDYKLAYADYNKSVSLYSKSMEHSLSNLTDYLFALNRRASILSHVFSNHEMKAIKMKENKLLRSLIPEWELWVNKNTNKDIGVLKFIYSNSPINLLATNYFYLYKISGNRGDADSFFYYTERSKLNSLLSFTKISSRPNFSIKSIKQVQSALTNNQSIVQYFNNYASGNYALLFLKDTFHLIDLGDDVFFDFKSKMNLFEYDKSSFSFYKNNSFKLYQLIFKPIASFLHPQINDVTIIPSVKTGNINFESLITDTIHHTYKSQPYLFKKYKFNYQLSYSLKEYLAQQVNSTNAPIAFCPNYQYAAVTELPFLSNQTSSLKQFYFNCYLGNQSSVSYYQFNAPQASVIHLAGHSYVASHSDISQNHLLLTNHQGKLEKLNVLEITRTKLNANLVVLALCETGRGDDYVSEANLNFPYYFFRAGAKSCVYGLSKLDDKSSAEILTYFYQFLNEGMHKDDALYEAKKKYWSINRLDEEYSPIFWAPLVVEGNLSPLVLSAQNPYVIFYLLGATLLFILIVSYCLFPNKYFVQ